MILGGSGQMNTHTCRLCTELHSDNRVGGLSYLMDGTGILNFSLCGTPCDQQPVYPITKVQLDCILVFHVPFTWCWDRHWIVFSDESHFCLWQSDCSTCVHRCTTQWCIPGGIVGKHTGQTFGIMVWGLVGQSQELTIGNHSGQHVNCPITTSQQIRLNYY